MTNRRVYHNIQITERNCAEMMIHVIAEKENNIFAGMFWGCLIDGPVCLQRKLGEMAKTEKEREVSGVKENKNASMWVPDMDGDSTTGLDHNEVLMAKFAMDRLSGKKSLKEQMGKFFWPPV